MILPWYYGEIYSEINVDISDTYLGLVATTWIRWHVVPGDDADHAWNESGVTGLRLDLLRGEVEDVLVTGEQRVETHVWNVSFVAVVVDGPLARWQVDVGPEWSHHRNLFEDGAGR